MGNVDDFIIDFSKEEAGGGGGIRVKPGKYPVKIVSAKPITSGNKGTPGLELMLLITDGKAKGKKLKETLYATTKAYGRFRALLEAAGKRVPKKVDLARIANAVKGAELAVEVDDEEREGYKTRSRVTFEGFMSLEEYEEDMEDGDEDDEDEDEDLDLDDADDDEDGDDLDDLDRAELKAHIKKQGLDVTVKKSMDDDDIRAAIRAADNDEEEDEDDEDEEPEPAPKPRRRRKKAAPVDEDDDDLDLDDL